MSGSSPISPSRTSSGLFGRLAISSDVVGLIPPLVTPLDTDGQLDRESMSALIRYVSDAGAVGVLVLGSTGEGAHLTTEEQEEVVSVARRADTFVLAGIPSLNARHGVDLAGRLSAAGADALLVPPPLAFGLSQTEVADYFRAIAGATDLPLIAYHVPSRVPTPLASQTVETLVAEGVLSGVKDSSGDLSGHQGYVAATASSADIVLLTGSETWIDAALLAGFHGAIPGLANVFPDRHVALLASAAAGEWSEAAKQQAEIASLAGLYDTPVGPASRTASAVAALKVALMQRGIIATATMSGPFTAADEALSQHVAAFLANFQ